MSDRSCRTLPELTRGLRALGSRRVRHGDRAHGADEERRYFAPFLGARRAAEEARSTEVAIAAFDPDRLAVEFDATLEAFAAVRSGNLPARGRAIEAELHEVADPVRHALLELKDVSNAALADVDDLERWRAWADQLRITFEVVDRVWMAVDAVLATGVPASMVER